MRTSSTIFPASLQPQDLFYFTDAQLSETQEAGCLVSPSGFAQEITPYYLANLGSEKVFPWFMRFPDIPHRNAVVAF